MIDMKELAKHLADKIESISYREIKPRTAKDIRRYAAAYVRERAMQDCVEMIDRAGQAYWLKEATRMSIIEDAEKELAVVEAAEKQVKKLKN